MHSQEHSGLGTDRLLVIGDARFVRRADLAKTRAAPRENVGHAKRTSDLDELATGDDDLFADRERIQAQHDRGGGIVHDERALSWKQARQQV